MKMTLILSAHDCGLGVKLPTLVGWKQRPGSPVKTWMVAAWLVVSPQEAVGHGLPVWIAS